MHRILAAVVSFGMHEQPGRWVDIEGRPRDQLDLFKGPEPSLLAIGLERYYVKRRHGFIAAKATKGECMRK